MGKKFRPSKSAKSFSAELAALRLVCQENGLEATMTQMNGLKRWNWHVVFRKAGRPVLHYWPSNGRVWNPETGEKRFVQDWRRALAVVTGENVGLTWNNSKTRAKRLERLA